jgi:hypothetical protein
MRGNKLSVDRSKKVSQRSAQFGQGGKIKMVKQQAACPARASNA